MNERFELSFKNKVVRMWFYLTGPTIFLQITLAFFTEVSQLILALIPVKPLTIFYAWYYLYRKNQKKEQSVVQ